MRCYQGNFLFTIINAAGTQFDSSISVPSTGVWHHAVGTYDGANVRLYLDGVQVAVTAASGAIFNAVAPMTIAPMTIGDSAAYPGRCLNGQVSMVTTWARTLQAQDVAGLYQQTRLNGLPAFVQQPFDTAFLSDIADTTTTTSALTITGTGISSGETFGALTVSTGAVSITLLGIASAEAFGSAVITIGAATLHRAALRPQRRSARQRSRLAPSASL